MNVEASDEMKLFYVALTAYGVSVPRLAAERALSID